MNIQREEGMSLLETLVAIAIFGMLSGGLLSLTSQENTLIRNSAEALSARLKANAMMETLKACPFDELKSFSSIVISEIKNMTIDVVVSDFENSQTLKKIVVIVKWFDLRGNEKQYMLATLRSQHPQRTIQDIILQSRAAGGEQ